MPMFWSSSWRNCLLLVNELNWGAWVCECIYVFIIIIILVAEFIAAMSNFEQQPISGAQSQSHLLNWTPVYAAYAINLTIDHLVQAVMLISLK